MGTPSGFLRNLIMFYFFLAVGFKSLLNICSGYSLQVLALVPRSAGFPLLSRRSSAENLYQFALKQLNSM
jgi:hypothetical protein